MKISNEKMAMGLIIFCLMGIIVAIEMGAFGGVFYQDKIDATNVTLFDSRTDLEEGSVRASADSADTLEYRLKNDWGPQSNGESGRTIESSYEVTGVKGGRYEVVTSGSGYKHRWTATDLTGNFIGKGKTVVLETGVPETDSLIIMQGSGRFESQLINGWTGRPVTESETVLIGNATIRSLFNASIPDKEISEADWLSFCEATYKTAMLDREGNGIYIQPLGYDLDEKGLLKRNMSAWRLNGTVLELAI